MTDAILERVEGLCDTAAGLAAGHVAAGTVTDLRLRLREPLRVAIAGRVKAGKSTLLNALVGEMLAPTDAGECTKIVTWYRYATGYSVKAILHDGSERPLRFTRGRRSLDIALDGLAPADLERIDVGWPSSRLEETILIDTPGLESMDAESSERTLRFLSLDEGGTSDVDAVIYLMRHMHRSDAEFLEAFMDRSLSQPSPVNAVAVLSRADEIGAGRIDALSSAAAIARRYAADDRVRSLCSTVLPVGGLIAETGTTLREDEVAALLELASMDPEDLEAMLVSVDRVGSPNRSPVLSQTRKNLLDRLGLFGIRFSLAALQSGRASTAADLSRLLVGASGVLELRDTLSEHFAGRAQILKARSVLVGLKDVARRLAEDDPTAGAGLLAAVEEFESTAHEFSELRLWYLITSASVDLNESDIREIHRLTAVGDPAARLGADAGTSNSELSSMALDRIAHWRERADHPLSSRHLNEACEIVARSYEALYASIAITPEA